MMEFDYALLSDIGLKRTHNEDNAAARPDLGLFIVADGMGGHLGGEKASEIVAEHVPERFQVYTSESRLSFQDALVKSIQDANDEIFKMGREVANLSGMGTTVVSGVFRDKKLTVGHVGDSRCYFLRPGSIWQITRDHSLVQEKLQAGIITREQAKTDVMKNVITRSVGYEQSLRVEVFSKDLEEGDVFLFCSDGLTGDIEDSDLLEIFENGLFQSGGDTKKTAQKLIELANARGGDDNITALIVRVVKL